MELISKSELTFYFQSTKKNEVLDVRTIAHDAGVLGSRIFVDNGDFKQIHITENLADIIFATEDYDKIEILRVLNPSGKAFVNGKVVTKSLPKGLDEWNHPRHRPDNNLLSEDKIIKAPYQTQFIATPRYGPALQSTVIANGRIFKAFGSFATHRRDEKYLNTLMGFNAYNGITLWKRNLPQGYSVHRNTMVATKDYLYIGTEKSCDVLDAATGELVEKININKDITDKQACKWLAIENDVLYLLLGSVDKRDKVLRRRSEEHGHVKGWTPFYGKHKEEWGHGNTLVAINMKNKKIIWHHKEQYAIDSRAIGMKNGKIFFSRFGEYIACINTTNGNVLWRQDKKTAPEIFMAFEKNKKIKTGLLRWDTNTYINIANEVVLFSGSGLFGGLIALSAENGALLWNYNEGIVKIIVTDNVVNVFPSLSIRYKTDGIKLDLLSGKKIRTMPFKAYSCVVTTGSSDSFFTRTNWGATSRYDMTKKKSEFISPMRPSCNEGIYASNGHLYWWPWICDCTSTLYGMISLAPKSMKIQFDGQCKLEQSSEINNVKQKIKADYLDWVTLRKDNKRSSRTEVSIPEKAKQIWKYQIKGNPIPTAPTTVGNTIFIGANNGVVYALDSKNGKIKWMVYTGGAINYPPSFWEGRVYVGSNDGNIYCFRASDGNLLWKSLLAPNKNKIPIYDKLQSIWPVASGVLIENGVAYVAAGMTDYDGTFVYALDAKTGKVNWKNLNSSNIEQNAGISVMGHLLSDTKNLYLAGGSVYSPAVYNIKTGDFIYKKNKYSRGFTFTGSVCSELYFDDSAKNIAVKAFGPRLYSDSKEASLSQRVRRKFEFIIENKKYVWLNDYMLICFPKELQLVKNGKTTFLKDGRKQLIDLKSEAYKKRIWNYRFHHGGYDEGGYGAGRTPCGSRHGKALVISKNALILTEENEKKDGENYSSEFKIVALNHNDGKVFWCYELPHRPVSWGLAVNRNGQTIISLRNGTIICYGK